MRSVSFFVDERHVWLDQDGGQMPNIGADGRNLTIVLLSLNRSSLTIRLLQSIVEQIPHYAGKVLIADNGSQPEEVAAIEAYAKEHYRFPLKILRFDQNFGVAGGRNKAFAEVDTDWILSLDNDIYLISNPLPQIQRDLAVMGCHFLSVPLVNPDRATFYSFGGHLQTVVQNGRPRLTISCLLPPSSPLEQAKTISPEGNGFICSFLFGGASLLRRQTFQAVGGFDDNMLIGFEDIDFSLRLFRGGYKVGSSAMAAFVHDHPPAAEDNDKNYESMRFSRQILKNSALYLEGKLGYKIWGDEVDNWLKAREEEQGLGGVAADETQRAAQLPKKPRIALVTDTENWAFANISRQIMRHLGDKYDFDMIPMTRLNEIQEARWAERGFTGHYAPGGAAAVGQMLIQSGDYDIVHFFWREFLTLLDSALLQDYAQSLGLSWAEFRRRFVDNACIITSVYDHLHCDEDSLRARQHILNDVCTGYYVASKKLDRIYRDASFLTPPMAVIEDGVDLKLFYPQNLARLDQLDEREIVIGWVGNSKWASTLGDKKGFYSILSPALEQLQAEGLPLRLHVADRQGGFIPHDRMVHYYKDIDLYICTSEIEGTPNPVLESMACGVPIISTDVGIVPQAFGPLQKQFILAERSVECLKEAIRRLLADRSQFRALSNENLDQIRSWDWPNQTRKFDSFFQDILANHRRRAGDGLTKMCMLPFTTPSVETDGSIRLCSASSIFNYRAETNMGNARELGLEAVWRGEKYRHIRSTLALGENLTPYCQACEYRFDGPVWLFQLHLALHAWHAGIRDNEVRRLLALRHARFDEYQQQVAAFNLPPYPPVPLEELEEASSRHSFGLPEAIVDGKQMPIYIDLNTLNRCNVACIMCPPAIRFSQKGHKQDPYYRLTLPEFERLTNGLNLKSAHFVGAYAEPLLNKEIFDLVKRAHDSGSFTAITSNVMALSEEFSRRLVACGLDMLSISLHGAHKEVAEAIMQKSDFNQVLDNIRALQRVKKEMGTDKPEIYFNFVSQLANIDEMGDFVRLAADLGVLHVNIIHLIDGDEDVDKSLNLVLYPDRLRPNVAAALAAGKELGVHVHVSPAYLGILSAE